MGSHSRILVGLLLATWGQVAQTASGQENDWMFGPFEKPSEANPILIPDRAARFHSPMGDSSVAWEAYATFNPAALVRDGKLTSCTGRKTPAGR